MGTKSPYPGAKALRPSQLPPELRPAVKRYLDLQKPVHERLQSTLVTPTTDSEAITDEQDILSQDQPEQPLTYEPRFAGKYWSQLP